MKVYALYNLKGGVGKTASTVNLSYYSALDGKRTLIWDFDPQGSASFYFKVKSKFNKGGIKGILNEETDLQDAIMETDYENLDILPADQSAKSLDILHDELTANKKLIKTLLNNLKKDYDNIFIDCPPGLSSLALNIFNAADLVLMPVIPTTLSVRTYHMVKDYFKDKDIEGSRLKCFFTMADLRKNLHKEVMEELYSDKKFFDNYIPYLSDVEKMGVHLAPIGVYAKNSYAAQCYMDLWSEIKKI